MPRFANAVLCFCVVAFLAATPSRAQNAEQKSPPAGDVDAQIVTTEPAPKTPAELQEAAWTMLRNAIRDTKKGDERSQALAATGLLGNSPRASKLIIDAMADNDLDIRSAAALAGGESKSPAVTTPLRALLDDKEPPVAFAAAVALAKMDDMSGEDILRAVADGERGTAQSMMDGAGHTLGKDFHHPGGVAKFAAMQGAGILLGPFGYGISAYEYLRKNGGDAARVTAIELLAKEHTKPVHDEFVTALNDKDPGVRLAAAKALREDRTPAVAAAVAKLFDDPKMPVRYTGAAVYLIITGQAPGVPVPKPAVASARRTRKR